MVPEEHPLRDAPMALWIEVTSRVLKRWMEARLLTEPSMGNAAVQEGAGVVYAIATERDARKIDSHVATIKAKSASIVVDARVLLSSVAKLAWIRPLNRQLQRLLGWGDALAEFRDVERTAQTGDIDELTATMSGLQLASTKQLASISLQTVVPAVWKMCTANPPLQDCQHLFVEVGKGCICARCPHIAAFACETCGLWLCRSCTYVAREVASDAIAIAMLHHTVTDTHTWRDGTKYDHCDECSADGYTTSIRICDCSAALCPRCLAARSKPIDPLFRWSCASPLHPAPFHVMSTVCMRNELKLEYVLAEVGNGDVELSTFCHAVLEIFADARRSEGLQKVLCMELCSMHYGLEYRKESTMPPTELTKFLRVWNPSAPARCLECGTSVSEATDPYESAVYCSADCASAGVKIWCKACDVEGELRLAGTKHAIPVCTSCGAGVWLASRSDADIARDERPSDALLSLRLSYLVWGFDHSFVRTPVAGHCPAWKRRRRS